ncbi:MAG: BlaI/MecI/CopY family transcriptional regulator [Solirubrobacteraceae bacterium]
MTDLPSIQGELQGQIMPALWRLGDGTVEEVRAALPARYRSAYTTVQTVLNRLADRGLLGRERRGNAIVYRPLISEAQYLSRSIDETLAGASTDARQAVLARLVGRLDGVELDRLRDLAKHVESKRSSPRQ